VRWSRDLGEGFSGIAVAGGRLFTMYRRDGQEVVVAMDAADGKTLWEHADAAAPHAEQDFSQGPGPHATPLVADGTVCAAGATARLRCLDAATGRLLWARDLVAEHGATVVYRGYSSSPIAHGRAIIVQAGGEGRAVMAFDRATGKPIWSAGSHANTNSSPVLLTFDGTPQVVAFMADTVAGFDAATGAELWTHPHPQRFDDNIARPIVAANGLLVLTSALDGGTRGLRISRQDGAWRAEEVWHQTRVGVYYTNAARAGDLVLASSGALGPTLFSALDPSTGAIVWQTRDILRSQMLVVGDRLLVLRDETGALSIATFDRKGVNVLATAGVLTESAPSPPSLVGTMLYARDRAKIVAVDLSGSRR
jgi:outer membrane protein assembly factor BamB